MGKKNIFIDTSNGRFANQLYPIFAGITAYGKYKGEYNKPLFKVKPQINEYCLKLLIKYFNCVSYSPRFQKFWDESNKDGIITNKLNNSKHIRMCHYCQDTKLIDEKIVREYIKCPEEIKNKIYELYGDLSDYVCVHVRRGDYCNNKYYNVLSKEYIERVISKHFPNDKIICISDDIKWCKENLSNNPNIIFADKNAGDISPVIIDFFIQTMTKGNICSGSSFSMAGVVLNPNHNKICIVPDPFFATHTLFPDIKIVPKYAIKEPLNIEKGEA